MHFPNNPIPGRRLTPTESGRITGKFTPSPIKGIKVMTKDGEKVMLMNRKERRKNKIKGVKHG